MSDERRQTDQGAGGIFRPARDGLLRREDFTAEHVAALTERVSRSGLWTFISADEREASRRAILAEQAPGEDLWIFGYGSLMWNPALDVTESRVAAVTGLRRNFCLHLIVGRATPEAPGLMLAVEESGDDGMTGVVHRIDSAAIESETSILWMREMLSGAYAPTWIDAETDRGRVRAIAFVMNKAHPRYAGALTIAEQARRIAAAAGETGVNRDYLYRCRGELRRMGVEDPYVEALFCAVTEITGEPGDPLFFGGSPA